MSKGRPLIWWPRDFAADENVVVMSLEGEGAYRRLLDHQWLHGSVPADLRGLAAICKGLPLPRMKRLWLAELAVCFHPVEGQPDRLQNRRLERVRADEDAYREKKARAGRASGKARGSEGTDGEQNGNRTGTPIPTEGEPPFPSPSPIPSRTASGVQSHSLPSEPEAQRRRGQKTEPQRLAVLSIEDKVEALRVLNQAARRADDASLDQRIARPP